MKSYQTPRGRPDTISVEAAGERLGISRNTAYEAVKRGEIPAIKIGRLLRVPVASFERLLGVSASSTSEAA